MKVKRKNKQNYFKMKRTNLRRSLKAIKRKTKLKRFSPKGATIKRCEDLLRAILKIEREARCELCGRLEGVLIYPLSLFHILDKKKYPRLRLHRRNLLLACWHPKYWMPQCHNVWHHNYEEAKRRIEHRIKVILGNDYRDKLLLANKTAPKITIFWLKTLEVVLKRELEEIS